MKIAVLGSNGKSGLAIINELIKRNIDATGFARKPNKSNVKKFVQKDIFDLENKDLESFDVVIDCFGVWDESMMNLHTKHIEHLVKILNGSKTRLLVVGGAGSLFINKEHTLTLADDPNFPEAYKAVAKATGDVLAYLRNINNVLWTYFSPAAELKEGPGKGKYILGGEEFILNSNKESTITYNDLAIAMVDEALTGNNIQKRITAVEE